MTGRSVALRTLQGLCVIGITAALALAIPRWSHPELLPQAPQPQMDLEMLVGLAIWGSVFVVVLSFVMELALLRLDPRIRAPREA